MPEKLNLILIIATFIILTGWSFFDLTKRTKKNKKFAEKNISEKIDKTDEVESGLFFLDGIIRLMRKFF
jgi:hypothetical protein